MSFFNRLSPVPQFHPYTGPYQVGSTDIEVPASSLPSLVTKPPNAVATVAFRLFYPCTPPSNAKQSKPIYWLPHPQNQILASTFRFLGVGQTLSHVLVHTVPHLKHVTLPVWRDAKVVGPNDEKIIGLPRRANSEETHEPPNQLPLLIFSHGLGGSRNTYSHILGNLASYGVVVVAVDHRDGSQPLAYVRKTEDEEAKTVDYKSVSHQENEDTFIARDDQLKIRLWELANALEVMQQANEGKQVQDLHGPEQPKSVLSQLKGRLDMNPGQVTFAGHSFGAASVIQAVKAAFYLRREELKTPIFDAHIDAAIMRQIMPNSPVMLLDAWALPIVSPATKMLKERPMPCYAAPFHPLGATPLLTVMSQAFYKWTRNRDSVLKIVSPPSGTQYPNPLVFYPSNSAHLSQSDFGVLFPRLTKYLAKAEEPERIVELNVRAILELLRRQNVDAASPCKDDQDPDDFVMIEKKGEEKEGDWRILSRESGAIRGWNFVPADAPEKASEQAEVGEKLEKGVKKEEGEETVAPEPMRMAEEAVVGQMKQESSHEPHEDTMEGLIHSGKA